MELLLALAAIVRIIIIELPHLPIAPAPIMVVLAASERLVAKAAEGAAEIVAPHRLVPIAVRFAPALLSAAMPATEVAFITEATEAALLAPQAVVLRFAGLAALAPLATASRGAVSLLAATFPAARLAPPSTKSARVPTHLI